MAARPLRIAVVHGLGFFYSGGGEKLVLQEVEGLRARGHHVDCFAPVVDEERSYPDRLRAIGARRLVPRLPAWVPYRDALAILAASVLAPFLASRFRGYDAVLAANQPAPWLAWWAKRRFGVRSVVYLAQPNRLLWPRPIDRERTVIVKPDYRLLRALGAIARPLIRWADAVGVRDADEVLANGPYMAAILSAVHGRPFRAAPAGAPLLEGDADRSRGALTVNGVTIRKPFVLLTNRHYPQKRFEVAVEALSHPGLRASGAHLVITGQETAYTERMRALARSNGYAGRVWFLGLTTEADLARLYAAAACYVYPSPEEDYGMGIVEAMAAGTPVVAWNAAGPTGTVVDGVTGFLVPLEDRAAFAERVACLVAHPEEARRLGCAARSRVIESFTLERHVDDLERAFDRALAR